MNVLVRHFSRDFVGTLVFLDADYEMLCVFLFFTVFFLIGL